MKRQVRTFVAAVVLLSGWLPLPVHAQVTPPLATAPAAAGNVDKRSFFSAALQRDMPYEVVLPADYAASQQRYPVLYLLHGWQGDETNWVTHTHLVAAAAHYRLLIVTPRAGNSWYVNSATHPGDRYADSMVQDLVADVDSHYRTLAAPQGRAIAGLSMGGYGALLLTLRHPGVFGFAGSISGALAGPAGVEAVMPALKPSTDEAYGPMGSMTRADNNLDTLIAAADPAHTPYLFLQCGTGDPFLDSNRHVVAELSARKFAYEYHELPGAHSWTFWDNALLPLLDVLSRQLHVEAAAPPMPAPAVMQPSH